MIKKLTAINIDNCEELRLCFDNDNHYAIKIAKGITRSQVVGKLRLLAHALENDKQLDDDELKYEN